jgi:hypothetical protein
VGDDPQDYLEKIFNIPFVLPRMSPDNFQQLVRSLAVPEPDGDEQGEPAETVEVAVDPTAETAAASAREPEPTTGGEVGADTSAVQTADLPVEAESRVAALQSTNGQPEMRPLTDPELAMLTALATLIDTPRETTRRLNLYRIIRSTRNLSPASQFLGDAETPGEYQAVVILLGLLSGHAQLLESVLAAPKDGAVKGGLRVRDGAERWEDFVAGMRPHGKRSAWKNDIVGPIEDADENAWTRRHRPHRGVHTGDHSRPNAVPAVGAAHCALLVPSLAQRAGRSCAELTGKSQDARSQPSSPSDQGTAESRLNTSAFSSSPGHTPILLLSG